MREKHTETPAAPSMRVFPYHNAWTTHIRFIRLIIMASAVFFLGVLQVKSFGLALVELLKKVLRERHECHQAK